MKKTAKPILDVFIMMPFHEDFNDVYTTIKTTVEGIHDLGVNFHCYRLDEIKHPGDITKDLIEAIEKSHICIADLTGNNPNVMYEVGYAHALKKTTILLSQNIKEIMFDIATLRTIEYVRNNLSKTLTGKLDEFIKNIVLSLVSSKDEDSPFKYRRLEKRSIFVTGSTRLDENNALPRIESLLTPYLGKKVLWYVGSAGKADELAAEFLCAHKEKVSVVGYFQFDFSSKMMDIIRANKLPFIDANKEQIVPIDGSPSKRDSYMKQKTDLSIYIWDGNSCRIKGIIDWSLTTNKDFIISFAEKGDDLYSDI